uniref:Uncharacterized protein n=1 Tax=Serinus canaria TaxID=9135 RepID=A0A8C9MIZ8_SERCA
KKQISAGSQTILGDGPTPWQGGKSRIAAAPGSSGHEVNTVEKAGGSGIVVFAETLMSGRNNESGSMFSEGAGLSLEAVGAWQEGTGQGLSVLPCSGLCWGIPPPGVSGGSSAGSGVAGPGRAAGDSSRVPTGSSAMFYLAAAVSDFYIPVSEMPEHKIQSSEGALQVRPPWAWPPGPPPSAIPSLLPESFS